MEIIVHLLFDFNCIIYTFLSEFIIKITKIRYVTKLL